MYTGVGDIHNMVYDVYLENTKHACCMSHISAGITYYTHDFHSEIVKPT